MDFKTMEQLAKHPDLQWAINQTEVAKRLGCSRQLAGEFLRENSVPFYRIGQKKMYLVWEVIDAIEKTRWRDKPVSAKS